MADPITEQEKLLITQVAQQTVDRLIAECRAKGEDPTEHLEALIRIQQETCHWAIEALAGIYKEDRGK